MKRGKEKYMPSTYPLHGTKCNDIFVVIKALLTAKLSQVEGPLAELHTHRTMPAIFYGHG